MFAESSRMSGRVLLQVRVAPRYGWIGIFGGPMLVAAALFPRDGLPWVFRLIGLPFGAAMAMLAYRNIKTPSVIMQVTDGGILLRARTGVALTRSLSQSLFIPWSRVQSMYYLEAKDVPKHLWWTSAWAAVINPLIVLRILAEADWPPSGTMRNDFLTRQGRPDEIYINAEVGSPGREELWVRMRAIADQLGLSRIFRVTDAQR
jgi:hypothetical protein